MCTFICLYPAAALAKRLGRAMSSENGFTEEILLHDLTGNLYSWSHNTGFCY